MTILFTKGQLNLDMSKKKEKDLAMWLSFNPTNASHQMYADAMAVFPKIKGLGQKRKAKIVFDIINIVEKHNKS